MAELTGFLADYGYLVIVLAVFLDQAGVPVPSPPLLIVAGALAGQGDLNLGLTVIAAVAGSLPSDLLWYWLGRKRGASVLRTLCRISIEPDSCVRNTENVFQRHGPRSLLVAKFIPGFQTAAPPLAGVFEMPLSRFVAYDLGGALLWSGSFLLLGRVFHDQLGRMLALADELGAQAFALIAVCLGIYLTAKMVHRQLFLRSLRIARVTPKQALALLSDGAAHVVDLRHALERETEPRSLPGAIAIALDEIEDRHQEIPRDRDVILFCT